MYTGIIIKESLNNPDILSKFTILKTELDDNWNLLWVRIDEADLNLIQNNLIDKKYYSHFVDGNTGVVIFKDKIFKMNANDRNTWIDAINYGKSIGVPDEQLDFEFDSLAKVISNQ